MGWIVFKQNMHLGFPKELYCFDEEMGPGMC
jgi:hypothetical protein